MDRETDGNGASRRDFLKQAALAAPAAAIAAAAGAAPAAAGEVDGEGLQETTHVRAYYDSARF